MAIRRILLVVALVGVMALTTADPAGADKFNPKVKVQGRVSCQGSLFNYGKVRWLYFKAWKDIGGGVLRLDEQGFATRTGDLSKSRQSYYFQFKYVPSGGYKKVTYEYGCGATEKGQTKLSGSFPLARPAVGGSKTVNICPPKLGPIGSCF